MDVLTAEDAIRKYLSGKKTPYQLDLEVKDRKPSIVPKVGDKVKIKSREWYDKWKEIKDDDEYVFADGSYFWGAGYMNDCLGKVFTVTSIDRDGYLKLDDDFGFYWSLVMFEEVYPVQEQLSSKFPKIDLNSPYLYQSPYDVKGSELVLSEEEQERLKEEFFPPCSEREKVLLKKQPFFSSEIEGTAKRLGIYSLVQGLDAKSKLKQIKTTHLLKLKKL